MQLQTGADASIVSVLFAFQNPTTIFVSDFKRYQLFALTLTNYQCSDIHALGPFKWFRKNDNTPTNNAPTDLL